MDTAEPGGKSWCKQDEGQHCCFKKSSTTPKNTRYSEVREEVLRERTTRMLSAPELTFFGKGLVPRRDVKFAEGCCIHLNVPLEPTSPALPLASLNFQDS